MGNRLPRGPHEDGLWPIGASDLIDAGMLVAHLIVHWFEISDASAAEATHARSCKPKRSARAAV